MSIDAGTQHNGSRQTNGHPNAVDPKTSGRQKHTPAKGLTFSRRYTKPGSNPLDEVVWEFRTCSITSPTGEKFFEQQKVEVPSFWSQMASNIVASKYLHGELGTTARESGVRTLISRVVNTIVEWGSKDGYFATTAAKDAYRDELTYILLHQVAAFNSPVWFNVGIHAKPQCHACFILSVDDSIDSLLDLQKTEALLFKYGSGTGTNFSNIRSQKEKINGGGKPSGPVTFMKAYDAWAGTIKSGGKTRRAAKMQILNVEHPDIVEFITCKRDEEKKAHALIDAGYDGGFAVKNGAYDSIAFQNANLSVRVTDEFMRAAELGETYTTRNVTDGSIAETRDARATLKLIAECTHACGDPGVQFDTQINAWHTCPNSGRINSSNPCSEYMHLDNSACNLSSLNLLKFLRDDGTFDIDALLHCVDVMITAQDILIDNASYPTEKIGNCAKQYRQLGLGYANLGALLMRLGLPYDSDAGREWAAAITSLVSGQAYKTSARLANALQPFAGYKKNAAPMLGVILKHAKASEALASSDTPQELRERANQTWQEAYALGKQSGYRNSQVTALAPTGTIAFMMDCDTTGIEPELALVRYKQLAGGGMLKLVNHSARKALERLGYSKDAIASVEKHIEDSGSIEGAPTLRAEHLSVFDCALKAPGGERFISHLGHIKMMAAVQPFISGAISKTVNMPASATVDEIYDVYFEAWRWGLKAIAIYRDGSKRTQPLNVKQKKEAEAGGIL